jgi:hypothetical protein
VVVRCVVVDCVCVCRFREGDSVLLAEVRRMHGEDGEARFFGFRFFGVRVVVSVGGDRARRGHHVTVVVVVFAILCEGARGEDRGEEIAEMHSDCFC